MGSTPGELIWTPALRLRDLIRRRELSPVELLDAVLGQVERVDGRVHAFVTLDAERAREAARAAEKERGEGLLHGLPVSIKDLEPTAGLRTTYGSRFFAEYVPQQDGLLTERVRAAGGIVFGKTNTPSWGHRDMCDNLVAPTTRNPWRLDRTPGGSSGGAGAAVASGMGPLAHGTDGAGSIRIPSALCGVFGFKASYGRVPNWPAVDFWVARTHAGPMTRTVRDAALLLQAIAGPDRRDPTSIEAPPYEYVTACEGDPSLRSGHALTGLRVAWSADFGYAIVDPEVRRVAGAAAGRFEELGCSVESVVPGWDDPAPWARTLWHASMAHRHGARYRERPEWFDPSLAEQIEAGFRLSAEELGAAMMARSAFYDQARRFMDGYDLLLTPQMPCTAWPVDGYPTIDGQPCRDIFARVPFTFPFNMTGWPAASLPCGIDSAGLPIGLQVVGPWRREDLVLRAAAAFEALQPWAHHTPAVAG
jgi:Asp-tRNA(Asn)/Glu-tRNA(Gln) amidotransferase A subunit family amidase